MHVDDVSDTFVSFNLAFQVLQGFSLSFKDSLLSRHFLSNSLGGFNHHPFRGHFSVILVEGFVEDFIHFSIKLSVFFQRDRSYVDPFAFVVDYDAGF